MKIFLLFILLWGCTHTPPPPVKTLNLALGSYPVTLDPRKSSDFISSTLICMLYEGLMRCLPGEEVELALAEKVEISDDQTIYTFFLKKAFWSDGQEVNARDFEKSWKAILNPEFPSFAPFILYPIKNGELYARNKVTEEEVGIYAIDDKTLKVVLERPTPHFLSLTAFPLLLPAPSHVKDVEKAEVINGPFQIVKSQINSEIILKKNPHFWNKNGVLLDEIKIQIIGEESTALELFEKEEIDYLGAPLLPLPPDMLPLFEEEKEKLRFVSMDASSFIAFNTSIPPFSNKHLRHAFSLAIDRERLAKELVGFSQFAATRALPPLLSSLIFPPLTNKNQAKEELEKGLLELGLTRKDLSHIALCFKTGQIEKRVAQMLEKEWEEALGITVEIKQLDQKTLMEKLHKKTFQIALASWIAHFHDPINLLERYKDKENPKNYSSWEHPLYQSLLNMSLGETQKAKRESLLREAETILLEELPIAPLYHWASPCIVQPRVKNLEFTASGGVLFERCFIEKRLQK